MAEKEGDVELDLVAGNDGRRRKWKCPQSMYNAAQRKRFWVWALASIPFQHHPYANHGDLFLCAEYFVLFVNTFLEGGQSKSCEVLQGRLDWIPGSAVDFAAFQAQIRQFVKEHVALCGKSVMLQRVDVAAARTLSRNLGIFRVFTPRSLRKGARQRLQVPLAFMGDDAPLIAQYLAAIKDLGFNTWLRLPDRLMSYSEKKMAEGGGFLSWFPFPVTARARLVPDPSTWIHNVQQAIWEAWLEARVDPSKGEVKKTCPAKLMREMFGVWMDVHTWVSMFPGLALVLAEGFDHDTVVDTRATLRDSDYVSFHPAVTSPITTETNHTSMRRVFHDFQDHPNCLEACVQSWILRPALRTVWNLNFIGQLVKRELARSPQPPPPQRRRAVVCVFALTRFRVEIVFEGDLLCMAFALDHDNRVVTLHPCGTLMKVDDAHWVPFDSREFSRKVLGLLRDGDLVRLSCACTVLTLLRASFVPEPEVVPEKGRTTTTTRTRETQSDAMVLPWGILGPVAFL